MYTNMPCPPGVHLCKFRNGACKKAQPGQTHAAGKHQRYHTTPAEEQVVQAKHQQRLDNVASYHTKK